VQDALNCAMLTNMNQPYLPAGAVARALGSPPAMVQHLAHVGLVAVHRCCHLHVRLHRGPSHVSHGGSLPWIVVVFAAVIALGVAVVRWRRNQAT
jgi:hypothetical protein